MSEGRVKQVYIYTYIYILVLNNYSNLFFCKNASDLQDNVSLQDLVSLH